MPGGRGAEALWTREVKEGRGGKPCPSYRGLDIRGKKKEAWQTEMRQRKKDKQNGTTKIRLMNENGFGGSAKTAARKPLKKSGDPEERGRPQRHTGLGNQKKDVREQAGQTRGESGDCEIQRGTKKRKSRVRLASERKSDQVNTSDE